jgi:hypothetical protein
MKKIALILLIAFTSCSQTDKKIDYANSLENCLTKNDIQILNESCELFESKLNSIYPDEPLGMKYKLYLKDIGSLKNPIDSPNDFLIKLKKSDVFNKIWIKYSELYYEDDSEQIQILTNSDNNETESDYEPKDFYVLNPKGEYFDCLINNQKNKHINEYLVAIRDILDISPSILANGLFESMLDKDYDDKTVRLIIALHLYYEIQFMIND